MTHAVLRRSLVVSLAFAFGTIFTFSQGLPSGFSLQVNGQIRYADSNDPADKILVRIESFEGGLAGEVLTDRTGKFSFNGLHPIQYIVTAHAPGFIDVREDVNLATSATAYLNIRLIRDRSSSQNERSDQSRSGSLLVIDSKIPPDAQKEYSAAKALLDQGKKNKTEEAVPHLQKAIAIFPDYLEANLSLGLAYMDLEQWDKAEKALNRALEINSGAITAYFALGELHRRTKQYTKAEQVLLNGVKLDDTSADGHYALANVYWEMAPTASDERQFRTYLDSSWKEVRRSLELNPKLARGHLLAGNLLLRARHPKEALGHFEEYLNLEPNGEFATETKALVEKIKQAMSQTKSS